MVGAVDGAKDIGQKDSAHFGRSVARGFLHGGGDTLFQ